MEIQLHDGRTPVLFRYKEGSFELCWPSRAKDKDTGEYRDTWEPRMFYANPAQALSRLLTMKVGNSDATTLKELKAAIELHATEIISAYGTNITKEDLPNV